jgi:hypothetical protein
MSYRTKANTTKAPEMEGSPVMNDDMISYEGMAGRNIVLPISVAVDPYLSNEAKGVYYYVSAMMQLHQGHYHVTEKELATATKLPQSVVVRCMEQLNDADVFDSYSRAA